MTRLCLLDAFLAAALWTTAVGAQVAAPATPEPASPFVPDTVLTPPGGPRILLLTSPGEGVAALRLAVPLQEGPAEAGAGSLLRDLALERMRTLARPVGAEVSAVRTPHGIAYSVEGAAADFEYLAYLLRQAVASPDVEGPAFQEARLRLETEVAADVETPARRIAGLLRAQVAPGYPPLQGTRGSVAGLDAARVEEVWSRSHQASAMTLVVSAPVAPEVVLAATRGMGAPEEAAGPPLDAPPASEPRPPSPEAIRTWYGEAREAGAVGDPSGPVVARLVAARLQALGGPFEVGVELWELPDRWALVVIGAARPSDAQAMRRAVSGALAGVRDGLDGKAVAAAVAELRRDLLVEARTPAGLVAIVGRAAETRTDPRAAADDAAALASVDVDTIRRRLDEMLRLPPSVAQVRP